MLLHFCSAGYGPFLFWLQTGSSISSVRETAFSRFFPRLPQPVQAMLSLLRENGVGTYRAAACIAGDENLRQRLVEAAWPARYEDAANYLLDCGNGPPSCSQLGKAEGVALVRCR